jgi:hypothetical protein
VIEVERWASWLRVRFGSEESEVGWVVVQKLARTPPTEKELSASQTVDEETSEAGGAAFLLKVAADHKMLVRIRCDLVNLKQRTLERSFDKETPVNIRFNDTLAVSCSVRDREHVESRGLSAELLHQGQVIARARTDAIYTRSVRLRSRGRWGPARSEVCRVRGVGTGREFASTLLAVDCRRLR